MGTRTNLSSGGHELRRCMCGRGGSVLRLGGSLVAVALLEAAFLVVALGAR